MMQKVREHTHTHTFTHSKQTDRHTHTPHEAKSAKDKMVEPVAAVRLRRLKITTIFSEKRELSASGTQAHSRKGFRNWPRIYFAILNDLLLLLSDYLKRILLLLSD